MKLLVRFILLTMTMVMINLANGKENIGNPTATAVRAPTATRSVPVHARYKKTLRTKIQRAVPFGMDDQDDDFDGAIDLHVAYRRPELVKLKYNLFDNEGLPKHITDRLAQAREMALEKYREKWA